MSSEHIEKSLRYAKYCTEDHGRHPAEISTGMYNFCYSLLSHLSTASPDIRIPGALVGHKHIDLAWGRKSDYWYQLTIRTEKVILEKSRLLSREGNSAQWTVVYKKTFPLFISDVSSEILSAMKPE